MKLKSLSAWVLFVLTASPATFGEKLELKKAGSILATFSLEELSAKFPTQTLKVNEMHEHRERRFKVLPLKAVLDSLYGSVQGFDEVLFTCLDGYQPSVPLAKVREFPAYLAVDAADGEPFEFTDEKTGEKVKYGPFYLVWDNLRNATLAKEGNEFWPYQIATIDLIRFQDRFPNLAPPEKSGAAVKRGFVHFRQYCLHCHTINGEGGAKAAELNYPKNVTEYFKESVLAQWILEPTSVRWNAQMFGLDSHVADRPKAAREIISYLRAMAQRKRPPATK